MYTLVIILLLVWNKITNYIKDWLLSLPWFLRNPSGLVDDWIGSIGWCYINAAWSGWWHIWVQELNKIFILVLWCLGTKDVFPDATFLVKTKQSIISTAEQRTMEVKLLEFDHVCQKIYQCWCAVCGFQLASSFMILLMDSALLFVHLFAALRPSLPKIL